MKDIIILGAGGAGMDIVSIIHFINKNSKKWNIIGFLDDNEKLFSKTVLGYPILGKIDDCYEYPNSYFISSIALPKDRLVRKRVFDRVNKYSLKFATIIHPSVTIFDDVTIGEGTIIKSNCILGTGVTIGNNVSISNGSIIGHESIIEDNATIGQGVRISSSVKIGQHSFIGCGVNTTHDIYIDSDVSIGLGAAVVSNIDKKMGAIWGGVPAKPLKENKKLTPKKIIILGAGGAGMDILSVINDINKEKFEWEIIGFLDDNENLLNKSILGYKVIGTIDDCYKFNDSYFISSIAHPNHRSVRKSVYERVKKYNMSFATLIHPSVVQFIGVSIGEGCIIRANSLLGSRVKLGNNVSVSTGCLVNHEVCVGDNTTMSSGVVIASGVTIGSNSYIGCGVKTAHDINIDNDVTIGVGATVVKSIDRSFGDVWVGTPAKPITRTK